MNFILITLLIIAAIAIIVIWVIAPPYYVWKWVCGKYDPEDKQENFGIFVGAWVIITILLIIIILPFIICPK